MKKWWSKLRRLGRLVLLRIVRSSRKAREPEGLPPRESQVHSEQQRVAFDAIRWYGRRKARRDIQSVHRRLVANRPEGALARQLRRLFPGQQLR